VSLVRISAVSILGGTSAAGIGLGNVKLLDTSTNPPTLFAKGPISVGLNAFPGGEEGVMTLTLYSGGVATTGRAVLPINPTFNNGLLVGSIGKGAPGYAVEWNGGTC
jgi:hypothetical protein